MADVEKVSEEMTALFLRNGNFAFATGGQGSEGLGFTAAHADQEMSSAFTEHGFHGLSVQSVGYSDGESGPRIYVYLTKGRSRNSESRWMATQSRC